MSRRKLLGQVAGLVGALLLSGCSGAYLLRPAPEMTGIRMTSAKVVWNDSTAFDLPVYTSVAVRGPVSQSTVPTISDRDARQTRSRGKAVLDAFRKDAVPMMEAALLARDIPVGFQTVVELKPLSITVLQHNGAVTVRMEVIVTQTGAAPWRMTVECGNLAEGAYWNVFRPHGIGDEVDVDLSKLVAAFTSTTAAQMRLAGWFL
ncbi:hypothetical protein JI739_22630 [Ramlibacter sp. AW1]|uniref:Lipoprotein n=1 Tax=Ramlibacter aurantiacus TaxID=2801330 RepID=A0A936ZZ63_9BURK|nr:hypothetical protein [Ramlibacter aurantiacus]MBL0423149.1 hypothetical protein [Ramlibacter aurantiacus]